MLAGHLYLPDRNSDLNLNKSGIYTLYEHYTNLNNIQNKNIPISSIYDDFKINNLYKYPYQYTSGVEVFNNENATNILQAGVKKNSVHQQNQNEYIQFKIKPKQDAFFSYLVNAPRDDSVYCYSFYVDNNFKPTDDLISDRPDSHGGYFIRLIYPLLKDIEYVLRIEFQNSFYFCIEEHDLAATELLYPYNP